jgi:hypothetical protein
LRCTPHTTPTGPKVNKIFVFHVLLFLMPIVAYIILNKTTFCNWITPGFKIYHCYEADSWVWSSGQHIYVSASGW